MTENNLAPEPQASAVAEPSWDFQIVASSTLGVAQEEMLYFDLDFSGVDDGDFVYQYSWRCVDPGSSEEFTWDEGRRPQMEFTAPHAGGYIVRATARDLATGAMREHELGVTFRDPFTIMHDYQYNESDEWSIKVDDVSMIFNIASEQFNSLKEYAIALMRHELKFKEFRALDGISFEVKRGEAFGLVGTNGSGKSTMLKIIAGVLEASEGSCEVRGTIAPLIELGAGFDMELTAKENIYLNGALLGYRREFIDEHFDDIVEFAELQNFMDMPLKNYSSGMVARIAFAIATITVPDILIVDEALSVGDFLFQQKCARRIRQLVESNHCTVLLVSHSIEMVEGMCDRVCWIEKGHQKMLGPTAEVCAAYRGYRKD